jgi:hypothetical protein
VVPSCEDVALDVAGDEVEVLLEFLELHHVPIVLLSPPLQLLVVNYWEDLVEWMAQCLVGLMDETVGG